MVLPLSKRYSPKFPATHRSVALLLGPRFFAHKLLAHCLKICLKLKDDFSAAGCDYIERVNTSVSQLAKLQNLTVPDVYVFVSLMGLYLSDASSHQKAYKELITYINDGNELTLDKVQLGLCHYGDRIDCKK